jgi:hypothetical protein
MFEQGIGWEMVKIIGIDEIVKGEHNGVNKRKITMETKKPHPCRIPKIFVYHAYLCLAGQAYSSPLITNFINIFIRVY